jgi:hypothetical protein
MQSAGSPPILLDLPCAYAHAPACLRARARGHGRRGEGVREPEPIEPGAPQATSSPPCNRRAAVRVPHTLPSPAMHTGREPQKQKAAGTSPAAFA